MDNEFAAELWLALRRHATEPGLPYARGVIRKIRLAQRRRDGRRLRREQAWARESQSVSPGPDEVVAQQELLRALHAALALLDADERELVLARYGEGCPANELAARRGVSPNTLRWRLKETLRRLRLLLVPIREPSMQPDDQLRILVQAIETRLQGVEDEWNGRVVVHLQPSPQGTDVERVELIPPAPRRIGMRMRKSLMTMRLPACAVPPFEMHFEVSPNHTC
ncbi:MAG: sigma-70 family RNA polymerase sigma factor [Nannocystaceae bacterium]|nr:sigma-70 family RNA polymerase sigma factor [Nannocystaceae bacterium]